MADQKDAYGRTIVKGSSGNAAGVRTGGAATLDVESRADAYLRQKKGSREEYPGEHEATAKKMRDEDEKNSSLYGKSPVTLKPTPTPSPKE